MPEKMYFKYAAMNASKSTALMQVAFNYEERDMRVVVAKPTIDTKSPKVVSRIGLERVIDWPLTPEDSVLKLFFEDKEKQGEHLHCILVDEAQFLTPQQVDELYEIAVLWDVPVMAYGLRSDFKTHSFPGSLRLLELAHAIDEIKTICRCGRKATLNARSIDGRFVTEGSQVAIDGQAAHYESLCGTCYFKKVSKPTAKELR